MVLLESIAWVIQEVSIVVKSIMMQELQTKMSRDKLDIVDVREQFETSRGHIKNAALLPLTGLNKADDVLDKDKTYYVVCQSGGRSLRAAKKLSKKGYDVVNVLGGMGAYKGPLVRE